MADEKRDIERGDAPVGVEDEGDVLHLAVGELLLELDPVLLEPGARSLDIVDGDRDVAEAAAGVAVPARVAGEAGVGLGAVVVRELEDALAVEPVVLLLRLGLRTAGVVEGEEVEREVAVAVLYRYGSMATATLV